MNQKRESAIGGTLAKLQRAQISFLEGKIGCSFDCQSIRLGALQKAMHIKGLYSPEPVAPFPGMDYQSLLATVRSFKVPRCPSNSSYCAGSSGEYYNFGCADAIDGLEIA